jgi:broad specificity phosphatase PhoE
METRFWLIRHALVAENERVRLYGIKDVPLCPQTLVAQVPMYRTLAAMLPQPAVWGCTPLQRTRKTAEAIFAAGYPAQELMVVEGLIEQNLGELQGLDRDLVPEQLTKPPHPFWPLDPDEIPPGGESLAQLRVRVGATMDALAAAHEGRDVVIVSHGGAIRGAIGHAMGVDARAILHLAIQNISLTRIDRLSEGWRVDCVNYVASF